MAIYIKDRQNKSMDAGYIVCYRSFYKIKKLKQNPSVGNTYNQMYPKTSHEL